MAEHEKIGPGPIPIETDEGWLLIYHGVINTCNGYVYRIGAALLDIDEPWEGKYRGKDYLLAPHELYECVGDVPNVTFPLRHLDGCRDRSYCDVLRLCRYRDRSGVHHGGSCIGLYQEELFLMLKGQKERCHRITFC